jgi:hypothetical protein
MVSLCEIPLVLPSSWALVKEKGGGEAKKSVKSCYKYVLVLNTYECSSNNSPTFFFGNNVRFVLGN